MGWHRYRGGASFPMTRMPTISPERSRGPDGAGAAYVVAGAAIAAATLVRWLLDPFLGDHLPYFTFFIAVAVVAWRATTGLAIASLVVCWLIADLLFVPPRGSFISASTDPRYIAGTLAYFAFAAITVAAVRRMLAVGRRAQHAEQAVAESQKELRGELRAMSRLQELSSQLVQHENLEPLLQAILGAAADLTGTDKGNIQVHDPDTGRLRIIAHMGLGRRLVEHFAEDGWVASCAEAAAQGQRVIVEDVATLDHLRGTVELEIVLEDGIRAIQCTPLVSRDGRLLGMLNNHYRAPGRPDAAALRYVDLLARQAADLIERHQALDRLQLSEEFHRRLMAVLPVGVYTIDAPHGAITYYNEQASLLWGRSPAPGDTEERWCGSFRLWMLDGSPLPHDGTPMNLALTQGRSIRNFRLVIERPPPDSSRVTVQVSIDPITDDAGRVVGAINVFHDVSAQHEAELALRQSEERLRGVFEQTLVGIAETDLTGRFVHVNRRYCEIVGRPAAELYGMRMQDVTHPDDLPENRLLFERAVADGTPFVVEKRYLRPDGAVVWVSNSVSVVRDGQGKTAFAVAASLDITDKKRAEQVIRDSEAHFRSMADDAPAMLWTTDPHGRRTFLSRSWYEFTRGTAEQHLGLGWLTCVHPDDRQHADDATADAHRRRAPLSLDYRLRRQDGEYRWVTDTGHPRFGEGGVFQGFVGNVTDIDERKVAEEVKDQFLAILSHELRSPLNAMVGWVQILKRAADRDQQLVDRAVQTLERNLRVQSQIVSDLLDVSRITSGKLRLERTRVDLAAVVAGVVDSMQPLADAKRITLTMSLSRERVEVDGDGARLQQAIGNLVLNAIKFTPDGGRVSVDVHDGDGQVRVAVADSGQGIEPELLPRVFDRFVQSDSSTTRRHGGLGLGLAIVKHLVAAHGGVASAESAGPGQGARFTVSLPLAPPALPEIEIVTPSSAGPSDAMPHADLNAALDVLLVEDDQDSREAIALQIESKGFTVRQAASVREALTMYDARPPDVLVSDIGMPGEDGYALVRKIRERESVSSRRTLAIAMTGFATRDDRETALRSGFDEHVGKPMEPEALVNRIGLLAASRLGPRPAFR